MTGYWMDIPTKLMALNNIQHTWRGFGGDKY